LDYQCINDTIPPERRCQKAQRTTVDSPPSILVANV